MGFNHHEINTNRTQVLSEYINSARFEDFPANVVERAKQILIETIGEALASVESEAAKKALALAECACGGPDGTCAVWGVNKRLSMENAAMANGAAACAGGWEQNPFGMPACAAVPTAWAVAEAKKRSGRELLTSLILAFEVYERVAAAVQPTAKERAEKGYGRASWQLFAALVPALRLTGLDTLQINKGLSMGTVCSVIPASHYESDGADTLAFEYGFRCQTAVTLACCALRVTENLEDAFDDPSAYPLHFTDEEHGEQYTQDVGKVYRILEAVPEKSAGETANDFQKRASSVFSVERIGQILTALFEIEYCEDLSSIGKLLTL